MHIDLPGGKKIPLYNSKEQELALARKICHQNNPRGSSEDCSPDCKYCIEEIRSNKNKYHVYLEKKYRLNVIST